MPNDSGKYRFKPFRPNEQELLTHVMMTLAQHAEMLTDVEKHHAAGERCGIVGDLLPDDRNVEYRVDTDTFILERFTFPEAADALREYDTEEELCVFVVRHNRDVAVLQAGRPGF